MRWKVHVRKEHVKTKQGLNAGLRNPGRVATAEQESVHDALLMRGDQRVSRDLYILDIDKETGLPKSDPM